PGFAGEEAARPFKAPAVEVFPAVAGEGLYPRQPIDPERQGAALAREHDGGSARPAFAQRVEQRADLPAQREHPDDPGIAQPGRDKRAIDHFAHVLVWYGKALLADLDDQATAIPRRRGDRRQQVV